MSSITYGNTNLGGSTNINGGGNPVVYSPGVSKGRVWEVSGAVIIPAGAYYVSIYSASFNEIITVNGEQVKPDQEVIFKSMIDRVNNVQDFVQEITINASVEDEVTYKVYYPSSSAINPNNI